jgi:putative NIF3 family GTP cyclohydrolase 1 type 2
MKMSDLIRVAKSACPEDVAWTRREPYGEHNIFDYNQTVKKVLYCVTPTPHVIDFFETYQYDLLISHHPFPSGVPQLIFHTALDCCEGGLNDQWRDHLELKAPYKHFDGTLGWYGEIAPLPFQELVKKVAQFSGSKTIDGEIYCDQPDRIIKSVVICSGLGGMVNELALATGADCYVIGEKVQSGRSSGFKALIETGHTNSEWMGVLLFQKILRGVQVDLVPQEFDYFGRETIAKKPIKRRNKSLWVA